MEQRTRMTARVGTRTKTYNTMTRMTERVGSCMMTCDTVTRVTEHGGTRVMTYGAEDTRDGTCEDTCDDI